MTLNAQRLTKRVPSGWSSLEGVDSEFPLFARQATKLLRGENPRPSHPMRTCEASGRQPRLAP